MSIGSWLNGFFIGNAGADGEEGPPGTFAFSGRIATVSTGVGTGTATKVWGGTGAAAWEVTWDSSGNGTVTFTTPLGTDDTYGIDVTCLSSGAGPSAGPALPTIANATRYGFTYAIYDFTFAVFVDGWDFYFEVTATP